MECMIRDMRFCSRTAGKPARACSDAILGLLGGGDFGAAQVRFMKLLDEMVFDGVARNSPPILSGFFFFSSIT